MTNRSTNLALVRDGNGEPERYGEFPAGSLADQLAALDPRTLDAVTRMLGQLERTTRAARPVVMYAAPAVVAAPATQSGPEPIDVRIPPAPAETPASAAGPVPRLFTRAEVAYYCGMTTIGTGGLGFTLAHFGANPVGVIPVIGAFWTLVSAMVIVRQDGRYGDAGDVRGRVKVRKGARR
jgi:hypothetical protein